LTYLNEKNREPSIDQVAFVWNGRLSETFSKM
jgi:hypothetical protein